MKVGDRVRIVGWPDPDVFIIEEVQGQMARVRIETGLFIETGILDDWMEDKTLMPVEETT